MFGLDPVPSRRSATEPSGFPSPAQDYFDGGIDLNRHLIRDRTSTFIMRVAGNSMSGAGIADGDEIIVDRSVAPRDGVVVVAIVEGELLIRRLLMRDGAMYLAMQPATPTCIPDAENIAGEVAVWGVVTRCLHHV